MRAIIDIGTNSVRLLLAEKDDKDEWKVLKKDLRSSRLGEGMTDTACIGQGARERTLQAVEGFVKEAKEAGADEIFAYGTSIMRDAGNGPDFAKLVEETTGVKVRILSGTEEAYYSYIGAAGTPGVLTAVVDIGGDLHGIRHGRRHVPQLPARMRALLQAVRHDDGKRPQHAEEALLRTLPHNGPHGIHQKRQTLDRCRRHSDFAGSHDPEARCV